MQGCGRCKAVFYCGRPHQKKDWKTHKSICRPAPPESSEPTPSSGASQPATKTPQMGKVDHLRGRSVVPIDPQQDIIAAGQGDLEAIFNLACRYSQGLGLAKDQKLATKYFHQVSLFHH